MKPTNKRKISTITISIVALISLLFAACAIYLGTYYRADEGAIAVFSPTDEITVSTLSEGHVVFEPQNARVGLIFYPGGKVEHRAYEPLMAALASKGILCILVEMPFRLAVFDIHAADGLQEQYPQITDWYIGGHSLGGSMAASHLADNTEDFEGLILLGSYSTADLSDTDLHVLSIYGSEDQVLNREKYEENIANLPDDFTEVVIEGGSHAQFGMYGPQKGDGTPTISRAEQTRVTVECILEVIE